MWGTVINVGAVLAGSTIGLVFRKNIPQKYILIIFQAIGLFTLFVGIAMSLKTNNYLILVVSLVLGGLIGALLNIDRGLDKLTCRFKIKDKNKESKFTEGLITSFLLFCMGSMTVVGAINEGLGHSPELLYAKSIMDGISSIALSAALGYGVMFSIVPLFLYQGGITLMAAYMSQQLTDRVINELTAVGGLLLLGLGFNILNIAKIKVINMLPSLIVILILVYFF